MEGLVPHHLAIKELRVCDQLFADYVVSQEEHLAEGLWEDSDWDVESPETLLQTPE